MNRLLLAMLLAAACKHSSASSSTSHSETSTVTDTKTSESGATTTTTTVTEAPGETTTTTEEFAPPAEAESQGPDAGQELSGLPAQDLPASPSATHKLPRHGPLVKRTVTVTKTGQETTQTVQQATQQAQGASETKAQGKADVRTQETESSKPALSCAFGGWLAIGGIVAAVFGLAFLALKRRGIV